MPTAISNPHPTTHVRGEFPHGARVTHGRPIVDRTATEETQRLHAAGIYGRRGEVVSDVLRQLIATA